MYRGDALQQPVPDGVVVRRLHRLGIVPLRQGLQHILEQLQLPGGEAGCEVHGGKEFEQAGLRRHNGEAVHPLLLQEGVRPAEQLPAVALAAGRRIGGQGVDVPGRGGAAVGQAQGVGEQRQHGHHRPVLQHHRHLGLRPPAVVEPVDKGVVVPEGRLPQPLLRRDLLGAGQSDVGHCALLSHTGPAGLPGPSDVTVSAKSQCAFPPTAAEPPRVPLLYFLGRNEWPRPPSLAAARQFTLSALRQAASQLVRAPGAPHRVGPRWKSPLRFLQNRSVLFLPQRQSRRGFLFLTSSGGMNPPCGKLLRSLYAPQARPTV